MVSDLGLSKLFLYKMDWEKEQNYLRKITHPVKARNAGD